MKIKHKLQREDFLFGKREKCPKDEIRYCYWYEYARESRNTGDPHDWSKTFSFLQAFPEWPATPWLKIKSEIRQKRIRQTVARGKKKHKPALDHLKKHTIIEAGPDVLRDRDGIYHSSVFKDNEVRLGERPADGGPTIIKEPVPRDHPSWKCHSYFVHKVDWRESWQENMCRFKEWFEANKPKDFDAIRRVDWKGATCWEGLKALAARRLVETYGFANAVTIAKEHFAVLNAEGKLVVDFYNSDRKTWKDALTRADEHLASFYRDSRPIGL